MLVISLKLKSKLLPSLLVYRWSRLAPAMDYAASTGWAGARFPWESAWTGGEVCPDFAADVRDYQHHVTGDISFAIRQYLAMTGDVDIFECFPILEFLIFLEIVCQADTNMELVRIGMTS